MSTTHQDGEICSVHTCNSYASQHQIVGSIECRHGVQRQTPWLMVVKDTQIAACLLVFRTAFPRLSNHMLNSRLTDTSEVY